MGEQGKRNDDFADKVIDGIDPEVVARFTAQSLSMADLANMRVGDFMTPELRARLDAEAAADIQRTFAAIGDAVERWSGEAARPAVLSPMEARRLAELLNESTDVAAFLAALADMGLALVRRES